MRYKDRFGKEYEETTGQDEFLSAAYGSIVGRALMKFLSWSAFSKCAEFVLDSSASLPFVFKFIEKNHIDTNDYEDRMYKSFNDFFKRKIKSGRRFVTKDDKMLVSPSDGRVSAYEINNSNVFVIKNSVYDTASLLRDKKLAQRFEGGTAVIIRLAVNDYHRYCYPANGVKSHDRHIKGVLHTVNPVVNKYVPVYKENSRTYCMIRSDNFGDIIQMEVGALLVGKITNAHPYGRRTVYRGEEKGCFEFGGSTIVLLLEKDAVNIDKKFLDNTKHGFETIVRQGDILGESSK